MKILLFIFLPVIVLAQQESWVYRYSGPGSRDDAATSIVYVNPGIIYAAGNIGYGGPEYPIVISLTPTGDTNWTSQLNQSGIDCQIVTDPFNNIYLCGSNWTFLVARINPSGDPTWIYSNPGNGQSGAVDLVYGSDSNLYISGWINWGGLNEWDYAVVSLSRFGVERWVRTYNGGDNAYESANSICYGMDGNIYSAGAMQSYNVYYFTVMSHNQSGNRNWYISNTLGRAQDIVYGDDSFIYAAGRQKYSSTPYDFTLKKYSPTGSLMWYHMYDGSSQSDDGAYSVVYGADNKVYAAGVCNNTGTGNDFTVAGYQPDNLIWVFHYRDIGNSAANTVIYGLDGKIYAGGYIIGDGNNRDCIIVCFSPAGDTEWVYKYNGPGNGDDEINYLAFGTDNKLYAAGYSTGIGSGKDFTVFCINPLAIEEEKDRPDKSIGSFTVVPNPFVSFAVIPGQEKKKVNVFNISGQRVGCYFGNKVGFDLPAGIYFIKFSATNAPPIQIIKIR